MRSEALLASVQCCRAFIGFVGALRLVGASIACKCIHSLRMRYTVAVGMGQDPPCYACCEGFSPFRSLPWVFPTSHHASVVASPSACASSESGKRPLSLQLRCWIGPAAVSHKGQETALRGRVCLAMESRGYQNSAIANPEVRSFAVPRPAVAQRLLSLAEVAAGLS